VLVDQLKREKGPISIRELSQLTCIKTEDILSTLQWLNVLQYYKGQYVIALTPKVRRTVVTVSLGC
jgi:hypothetical protein